MPTTQVLDGRYELGPVLGQGGMARVHRARDRQLRRPVAVKILAPPFDRDRGFVERFRREARSAAGLGHPNIVAVFDTGSDDGTPTTSSPSSSRARPSPSGSAATGRRRPRRPWRSASTWPGRSPRPTSAA